MRKRWLSLFVENEIGVLAYVSGLFSGKSYNLDSLTVGTTEDTTISRMTISLISDDQTFEQIKKQLNRSVDVIKIIDLTDKAMHQKELLFVKIYDCSHVDKVNLTYLSQAFSVEIIDYTFSSVILQCLQEAVENDRLIKILSESIKNRTEIVRGGSVAIEAF